MLIRDFRVCNINSYQKNPSKNLMYVSDEKLLVKQSCFFKRGEWKISRYLINEFVK